MGNTMSSGETPSVDPDVDIQNRLRAAIATAPALYVNGFVNIIGSSDICTVLECNNNAIAVVNMSYTTAKSYALLLGRLIATLEAQTGREIMTTDIVDTGMGKASETVQ